MAIVLPLAALVVGLIYLRLLQGPISVGFLLPPVERALKDELPDFSISIDDAIVRLSEQGAIEFRLKNVRIDESDGDTVALAPLASVQLSTRALLFARIAPARIELIEPRILVSEDDEGRLSLIFTKPEGNAHPKSANAVSKSANGGAPTQQPGTQQPGSRPEVTVSAARRFDLARILADASRRARRQKDAASFLEAIGLRKADVTFEAGGKKAEWQILEFDVSLEHSPKQKRSIITGTGKVASATGPWSFSFRTEDSQKSKTVKLDASIQDLVPNGIAEGLPQLAVLRGINLPLSGNGSVELSTAGEVLRGHFGLEFEPGELYLPWLDAVPLAIGSGKLDVRYTADTRRFDLGPSTLSWGKSRVVIGGTVSQDSKDDSATGWRFDLRSLGGTIAAEDMNVPALNVDRWVAKGRLGPDPGRVRVDGFQLDAGGARIVMSGDVGYVNDRIEAQLDGQIGTMPIASLKALWPSSLARRARVWAAANLDGTLKGGSFKVTTSKDADAIMHRADGPEERRLALTLEGADLRIGYVAGLPPIEASRALLRVEGDHAEVTVPEAFITADQGQRITLKSGRLEVSNVAGERPLAEVSLKAQAPVSAILNIAEREPIALARQVGINLAGLEGKAEGQLHVTVPLGDQVTAADLKLEGKARITEGRAKDILGSRDIHGATILIEATEKSVDLKGDMLLGGVNMRLSWQHLLDLPEGQQQSPLKISAKLDNSDRAQLGLDLNHMVQGEVPVEVTVQRNGQEQPQVRLVADLTGAELMLDDISWRKPPGRPATLQFDVIKGHTDRTELQNFRLIGENVAIDGTVELGADNQAKEFDFPGFSLNVVTNMDVHGVMRPGRVWDVKARGKVYDANDLFRSLIAFGRLTEKPHASDRPGLDLTAEIDTVLGASDTAVRGVKVKMQKRAEQLTMLDVRGTFDGGKPLIVRMRHQSGRPRVLVAETPDAGQALKLIGFYPNMIGGEAQLDVNLDGGNGADRSGVLTIRRFRVLGDPVVAEVVQNVEDGQSSSESRKQQRRVVREQVDFDRLRAPFSMGNGQLVLDNANVKGDVLGATIRGKIDYKSQKLQLGGTYVPLSGVNSSFAPIPILGPILTGPRGEGVLGVTYAIEGPMANPQVMVNPLSFVLPGMLREIFQMTPENPRVTPREERAQRKSGSTGPQIRASPPSSGDGTTTRNSSGVLDGWSADTTAPAGRVK